MTTSETEFAALINRYPSETGTIDRLSNFLVTQRSEDNWADRVYSLARLTTLLRPESSWNFAHIVAELANNGILVQLIRLKSQSGVGLADFTSYEEVPDKIHDITIDQDIEVSSDDLEVLYKISADG
jgi:hypothetical protein